MGKIKEINWNQFVRKVSKEKVESELITREIDPVKRKKGINLSRQIKEKMKSASTKDWNSTEELRKWRNVPRKY